MNAATPNCSRILHTLCKADLDEGTSNEGERCQKAAMKHGARAPTTPTFPVFSTSNAMSEVFIRFRNSWAKNPKALAPACGLSINARLISLTAVLRHRACDGIIEASVQRPKVVGADGSVQFHRQFGDGLADVAIVVHDLRHREPLTQEVMAVLDRAVADLRARNQYEAAATDTGL
jgi:hypothetical protein